MKSAIIVVARKRVKVAARNNAFHQAPARVDALSLITYLVITLKVNKFKQIVARVFKIIQAFVTIYSVVYFFVVTT